jgi:hypothetical protein
MSAGKKARAYKADLFIFFSPCIERRSRISPSIDLLLKSNVEMKLGRAVVRSHDPAVNVRLRFRDVNERSFLE